MRLNGGYELTSLEDKGRGTTGICEDTVEKVIRGEAEGYEGQRQECWKPRTHFRMHWGSWGIGYWGIGYKGLAGLVGWVGLALCLRRSYAGAQRILAAGGLVGRTLAGRDFIGGGVMKY